MEDAGYRPPKVKREPHDQRFEAVRPNHLWHLDFVQRHIHRASTFTLILIDDCSRFVAGHGVDDAERADMVIRTFEEAVARTAGPSASCTKGRGVLVVARHLALHRAAHRDGHRSGRRRAEGVERQGRGVQRQPPQGAVRRHRFYDVAEMRRRLAAHLHWYNHARTHHALGGLLVPADRYYGRVDEVLARIEAGARRDGDDLDLRERCLELFKVTSREASPRCGSSASD